MPGPIDIRSPFSPTKPPGWSEQEKREVAALREKERDLTAVILTHPVWSEIAAAERPDARSQLKHALEREDGEGQEAA
ncbi:nucleic acid-binding protein [Streptomyces sp. NPDC001709]